MWVALAGLGFGLFGLGAVVGRSTQADQTPLLVQQVRDIGELHTASQTMTKVMEFESHREPQGWVASLPLAKEAVAVVTSNRALASVTGEVEAGVDLSQAEVTKVGDSYTVFLPPVKVYEPVVTVTINSQRSGLMWRDLNVSAKAQKQVASQMKAAGVSSGLTQTAEKNARARIESLLGQATRLPIKVEFRKETQ